MDIKASYQNFRHLRLKSHLTATAAASFPLWLRRQFLEYGSMLKGSISVIIAIASFGVASIDAHAVKLGKFEYRNSCVQCHGASGKGDGWLGGFLSKAPSDLTVLQKNNGGVFPVERVYKIIEGSEDVLVHGPREMPVWGDRFRARPQNDEDAGFRTDEDVREYARTRIMALIEHLSTMQTK